jgi:hypothetical protein
MDLVVLIRRDVARPEATLLVAALVGSAAVIGVARSACGSGGGGRGSCGGWRAHLAGPSGCCAGLRRWRRNGG